MPKNAAAKQKYITADQLLERWGHFICKGTLSNWRHLGKGPAFVKFGRQPLYPIDELEEWEAANMKGVAINGTNEAAISADGAVAPDAKKQEPNLPEWLFLL